MKRWIAAVIAAVLLVGIGIAIAVGSGTGDPLVSKSYIEDTFLPALSEALQKRAADGTGKTYQDAVSRLDQIGEADVTEAAAPKSDTGAYLPKSLRMGSGLTLKMGGSVILYQGSCNMTAGTMIDVTNGTTLKAGSPLTLNHRYIVTSEENVELEMVKTGRLGCLGVVGETAGGPVILPFNDVFETDWYVSAVRFVYERGYFEGTEKTKFSPKLAMNRAMLATVLYRYTGVEVKADQPPFTDVPMGQWYTDGVAWASSLKIVSGPGDGTFRPNNPITREQMMAMLYNFANLYAKIDVSARGDLSQFRDADKISSYARDAVSWGVAKGLLNGRDTGDFDPAGYANRSEVAALLQRFIGLLEGN